MNLSEQFQQYLKNNFWHLSTANCRLILAVSGGVDSIVMTDLVFKSGFEFLIAHCNFQLRGEESERDEAFVRELGEKYNKEVLIKRFDTKQYAGERRLSIQETARDLRYDWFGELQTSNFKPQTSNLKRQTSNLIATAHNADDNVETMLMFLFRGTGIQGLTGIRSYDKERKIIRPLLFATREEILAYAKENNLNWVEDSSNASDKYTRNFFRNEIMPAIAKHFPHVKDNLLHNLQRFCETERLYQQAVQFHKKNLFESKGNEIHIPVLKLQRSEPLDTILWEIIKEYNFHSNQVHEVKKLFSASNSSYVQSDTHRIIKDRKWLIIAPNASEGSEHILIEAGVKNISFRNGNVNLEIVSSARAEILTNKTAHFDADRIEFPLILRQWKHGDYFYPLGMAKKKKLSRFFIDQKLSKTEKENIWIIEMNKKILWVIGHRIDDRFKLSNTTKGILKISFKPTLGGAH